MLNADDAMRLGSSIKLLREGKQMTQRQLAELAGCAPTTISRLERGADVAMGIALGVAKALGVTLDELLRTGWKVCPRCLGSGVVHGLMDADNMPGGKYPSVSAFPISGIGNAVPAITGKHQ